MNVQAELRWLKDRVTALEARTARPAPAPVQEPAKRKRAAAPKPDNAVITKRLNFWSRLVLLHLQYGHGRLTKLKVCVKYGLGDPSDLCRFLSAGDARGVPEGSIPALRYYGALREFIAELEGRRDSHSHGNRPQSQSLTATCSSIAHMSMRGDESTEELVEQERECLARFRAEGPRATGRESRAFEPDRVLQSGRAISSTSNRYQWKHANVRTARRACVAAGITLMATRPCRSAWPASNAPSKKNRTSPALLTAARPGLRMRGRAHGMSGGALVLQWQQNYKQARAQVERGHKKPYHQLMVRFPRPPSCTISITGADDDQDDGRR